MTVRLSFKEKTDDARACAQSGHCPFKSFHICAAWAPLVLIKNSTAILEERGSFGATWAPHVRHVLILDKFEV